MAIGLLITGAAISAYLGAADASRMSESQARMNEDAQAALTILTQHIRMAGNNPIQRNRTLATSRNPVFGAVPTGATTTYAMSQFAIRGCDGTFTNISNATDSTALACNAGANALTDSISITYEADPSNTEPTAAGVPADCLGNGMTALAATFPPTGSPSVTDTDAVYRVAENRFFISSNPPTIPEPTLYCKGNGAGLNTQRQPLVENIENLQITYGVATVATPLQVAGYLTADELVNEASFAALSLSERWAKVLSVRICVIARSATPVVSDANSARYLDCTGTIIAAPDLRMRRAYSNTLVLRNRLL
jgi:type IV pilus assembly protein PilW